ncbi:MULTISPECIES: LytR/AlgR family response regulator transcription factor [Fusobacterium]|nr:MULTISPECIES: LytTR family DNA-binding domain-containing protein [Fusobacterium]KXA14124.1 putative sensory transduction protein LytT [Fusobacterium equinum]
MRCVIVDDEFPAREELKYFISKFPGTELTQEFGDSLDAFDYLQEHAKEVDVLFLDINMPELNGLNLGKIIRKLNPAMKIIFVTAYREYAVDAFEIQAFDYLLKPYSEDRIEKLLSRLSVEKKQISNKVSISVGEKIMVFNTEDIIVVEADKKESRVYTTKECYLTKMKISDWEEQLPENQFYRCHRSYLVNLSKVREIEPWFNNSFVIHMENCPVKIPVSRNNMKEFKSLFQVR